MANTRRFASPEILTDETLVLGVPLKEWDKVFVGDFQKTLSEISNKMTSQKPSIADAHDLSPPNTSAKTDGA